MIGFAKFVTGRSAAWLARLVRDQEVDGSNPFAPTIPLIGPIPPLICAVHALSTPWQINALVWFAAPTFVDPQNISCADIMYSGRYRKFG